MPKPLIPAEAIYASALELLDDVGPDALQARRLSAHLGISTRTLYQQVGNRDELTRALVARHFRRMRLEFKQHSTWEATAFHWCMTLHDNLQAHPHLTGLMTIADRQAVVAYVNELIKITVKEGFSRRIAVECSRSLANVTLNHAIIGVRAMHEPEYRPETATEKSRFDRNFPQTVRWIIAGVRAS